MKKQTHFLVLLFVAFAAMLYTACRKDAIAIEQSTFKVVEGRFKKEISLWDEKTGKTFVLRVSSDNASLIEPYSAQSIQAFEQDLAQQPQIEEPDGTSQSASTEFISDPKNRVTIAFWSDSQLDEKHSLGFSFNEAIRAKLGQTNASVLLAFDADLPAPDGFLRYQWIPVSAKAVKMKGNGGTSYVNVYSNIGPPRNGSLSSCLVSKISNWGGNCSTSSGHRITAVEVTSGPNLSACYQYNTCSVSCP